MLLTEMGTFRSRTSISKRVVYLTEVGAVEWRSSILREFRMGRIDAIAIMEADRNKKSEVSPHPMRG